MTKAKAKQVLDLDKLTPEERRKVERALHPRDTPFSLRFSQEKIDAWRVAAETAGQSITDWVEAALDAAIGL